MKRVNLHDIRIDGGTQSRVVIDQPTVYYYIECAKGGDEFPPLETVFDGATHWLVDGFHRYHAYKLMGLKQADVVYKPGTQSEAQIISFGVNGRHGKPRTVEDKRNAVEMALGHPDLKDATMYEIAKVCAVSQPFVAGVKDPEKKKKQKEAKEKNIKKKAEELHAQEAAEGANPISTDKKAPPAPVDLNAGAAPDEDELRANELALQADMDIMYKMLESDDALATANEEIKRLNHQNAQLEIRLHGLMNERNQAIKMVKDLQKQLDKAKAKK
jgi:ParB-like chromosome segregation protein Spo0J